jgi:hypothetical protein
MNRGRAESAIFARRRVRNSRDARVIAAPKPSAFHLFPRGTPFAGTAGGDDATMANPGLDAMKQELDALTQKVDDVVRTSKEQVAEMERLSARVYGVEDRIDAVNTRLDVGADAIRNDLKLARVPGALSRRRSTRTCRRASAAVRARARSQSPAAGHRAARQAPCLRELTVVSSRRRPYNWACERTRARS